jgi:hypothetical protein
MMTLRCKPGDLALVIEGSNTGAFVDVLRRGDDHPHNKLPAWVCRIKADMMVTRVVNRRAVGEWVLPAGETAHFCDNILQPIRPGAPPLAIPAPEIELATS